jgi:hypothetical protein
MLREDLSPKPVYKRLHKLIHEEWRTKVEGKTDAEGRFGFSGYHGDYRVSAELGGREVEAGFHLTKAGERAVKVVLP